jgi:hypothetical protein
LVAPLRSVFFSSMRLLSELFWLAMSLLGRFGLN